MIEQIIKITQEHVLDAILLSGFVDLEEKIAEFHPILRFLYFDFNSQYLEFESIEQFSKLRIRIVDSIRYDFDLEEGMLPCKSIVSEIILTDTLSDNRVHSLLIYGLEMYDNEIICDAIGIQLRNGQLLFLDPSFYFGINIGGIEQENIWKENFSKTVPISIRYMITS